MEYDKAELNEVEAVLKLTCKCDVCKTPRQKRVNGAKQNKIL
jgi:hypothetical protein